MALNSSTSWGVAVAVVGLATFGIGIYLMKASAFCGPTESHAECARAWLSAIGPIIAMGALLISFWQMSITRDSSERQIRAYVGFQEGGMVLVGNGTAIAIQGWIKNYGKSPASDLRTWVDARILPRDDHSAFGPRDPALGKGATSILYPDDRVQIGTIIALPPEDLEKIRSGEKKIFVWGGVNYKDVFGNERVSNFYDVNGPEQRLNSGTWPFQPATRGYEGN